MGEDVTTERVAGSRPCVVFDGRLTIVPADLRDWRPSELLNRESQSFGRFHAGVAAACNDVSEQIDSVPGQRIKSAARAVYRPRSNSRRGAGSGIHGSILAYPMH